MDLSAIYLDVLKDRMYTFAPSSIARRSAQTVLWKIAEALVRMVAPVLSFTADEVWQYLPHIKGRPASVHLAHFPKPDEIAPPAPLLLADWEKLFAVRDEVLKSLEADRKAGKIGKALEAKAIVTTNAETAAVLHKYESSLKELFNVSQAEIRAHSAETIEVATLPADGNKCERCWNYMLDVAAFGPWPNVCGRCASALEQMGYKQTVGV